MPAPPRSPARPALSLLALAVALAPALAAAQAAGAGENDGLRRELIAQAESARDAGEHARAVDLARRAAQLRSTPSLSLMIAQEEAALGHPVEALEVARRCASEATIDAALRHRARILRECTDLARQMEGRLARLTVQVPAGHSDLAVEVAGRALPSAAWGVAVPVAPGSVTVTARARDGRSFTREVTLAEGQSASVEVTLTASPARAPEPVADANSTAATASTAPPLVALAAEAVEARRGASVGPWILVGLGGAALAGAGVFWMLHDDAIAERDRACSPAGCRPSAIASNDRAQSLTLATNVSLALGGSALVGGLVWWVVARARSSPATASAPRLTGWVYADAAMVGFGGAL